MDGVDRHVTSRTCHQHAFDIPRSSVWSMKAPNAPPILKTFLAVRACVSGRCCNAAEQHAGPNFELHRELQYRTQVWLTATVLVHADRGPIDFGVKRKPLLGDPCPFACPPQVPAEQRRRVCRRRVVGDRARRGEDFGPMPRSSSRGCDLECRHRCAAACEDPGARSPHSKRLIAARSSGAARES